MAILSKSDPRATAATTAYGPLHTVASHFAPALLYFKTKSMHFSIFMFP